MNKWQVIFWLVAVLILVLVIGGTAYYNYLNPEAALLPPECRTK